MKNKELKDFIYRNVYQNTSTGYVLTPSELAFEMVQTLPKTIFKSDSTTFLDPICKSGTFLFEIVEELYSEGHSIKNIESRVYTIDSNSHSLNVANSYIKKILNKLSGSFKIDYKGDFSEKYYNRLILSISKGKNKTFDDFLSIIMIDKTNKEMMKELQKNISEFIIQYEKVSKLESKLFGEVFTPRKLIDEMLDTLPEEVWNNKDLKWLDPAAGIGNFPAAILDRLMIGLSDEIKDELERKKYILEEMLYFCDISIKNLFLLYKLFDCNNEFKLNVYRGSFLEESFDKHMKEVWKLNSFDLVVGNPPYQKSGEGRAEKLWTKFIAKSSDISKNGYTLFVTPNSWLAGSNNIKKGVTGVYKDYFCKYKLIYANIEKCNHYFPGVGVRFSYFLLKSEESSSFKTKWDLVDGVSKFDIRDYKFLPPNMNKTQISINNKFFNKNKNYDVIPLTGGDKLRRFGVDNIEGIKNIKTYVRGSNLYNVNYAYFDKVVNESVSEIKKVVIPMSGAEKFMPFVDIEGIPVCISSYLVRLNHNDTLDGSLSFFNSKIVKFIFQENRSSGFIQVFVAKSIPIMNLSKVWTNQDLYTHFDLTQEEINLIEKTIKD